MTTSKLYNLLSVSALAVILFLGSACQNATNRALLEFQSRSVRALSPIAQMTGNTRGAAPRGINNLWDDCQPFCWNNVYPRPSQDALRQCYEEILGGDGTLSDSTVENFDIATGVPRFFSCAARAIQTASMEIYAFGYQNLGYGQNQIQDIMNPYQVPMYNGLNYSQYDQAGLHQMYNFQDPNQMNYQFTNYMPGLNFQGMSTGYNQGFGGFNFGYY